MTIDLTKLKKQNIKKQATTNERTEALIAPLDIFKLNNTKSGISNSLIMCANADKAKQEMNKG